MSLLYDGQLIRAAKLLASEVHINFAYVPYILHDFYKMSPNFHFFLKVFILFFYYVQD